MVDLDKSIEMSQVTPNLRVALRNDSYTLHKILPSKIDPLVSLMMVEKVPDSTYDMVGGLDKQIKEIKEVCSELFRRVYNSDRVKYGPGKIWRNCSNTVTLSWSL